MKRLHIAILCYPTMGGSGVVATQLAISLAERGHAVHLLSYAAPSRLHTFLPNLRFHLVQVSSYPLFRYPSYDLALAAKVIEIAGNERLDIVHAHYAIPHSISAILARDVGAHHPFKVLTTLHGTDITLVGSERAYVPLIRHALERSDAVSAVSQFLARETHTTFCADCEIQVIPNFVDRKLFKPPAEPRDANMPPTMVHISNFRPVKRALDVIRVFRRVHSAHDSHLLLVGDGPELAAVQELAHALDLSKAITFLGQQTDIPGILARSDIFLLTSQTESFGLSLLEALACGVPPVSYAVGGVPEVVQDGSCGLLCPFGDLDAMARACIRLIEEPELRSHLRAGALERAENFDKSRILDRYIALYERTLAPS